MRKLSKHFFFLLLFVGVCLTISAQNPKREFRGAWLHVIGQSQYQQMNPEECRDYITDQLDKLLAAGCNAVIFQVRPTADALYISDMEPWSAWLTGKRGRAPEPLWDPLQFTLEEAHKRGMEFHAWLNPYRVTSSPKEVLPASHLSNKEPHRFVKFDGKIFFDPAYQENRDFICDIIRDITERYDVDAIHIDDYFYPYPNGKRKFNADNASYARFGGGMNRNDWRRKNVDMLIEQLHQTIKETKPWVRFGVSPFGIWRNKKSDSRGSDSGGLQNYDDLYADVLLWAKNGWVDYLAPQLYWELDLKVAPSRHLAEWWDANANGVDIYIGQDVRRTMNKADRNGDTNELATKVAISRRLKNVKGNVWWHGYWVTENLKGVADSLALKHQNTIALPPAYGEQGERPRAVKGLRLERNREGLYLKWDQFRPNGEPRATDPIRFVVYQFFEDETPDLEDPQAIVSLGPDNEYMVTDREGIVDVEGCRYAVTALDRLNRESEAAWVR